MGDFFRPHPQDCIRRRRRAHVSGVITANDNMAMTTYVVQPRMQGAYHGRRPTSTSTSKGGWNDPEVKRQRRVAKYNMYAVEGKCKASIKQGFRWLKDNCSRIVRGY